MADKTKSDIDKNALEGEEGLSPSSVRFITAIIMPSP
jgi:hypothetical protein